MSTDKPIEQKVEEQAAHLKSHIDCKFEEMKQEIRAEIVETNAKLDRVLLCLTSSLESQAYQDWVGSENDIYDELFSNSISE